jgi:hypothetical protein
MLLRRQILALPLALGIAGRAAAQGYSPDAERVLGRAFAATGGKGWYQLRGWREAGKRGGLAYESWIDPLRYGLRTELQEPSGLRLQGFNGQAEWEITPAGEILAVNDRASLARVRTEAFFGACLYHFPGRFDARAIYIGSRDFSGRAHDVVRMHPIGGDPRELWFERRSGLLGRIVDRSGRRAEAVRVSDYRKVGPILVPFRFTAEAGAAPPLARERESVTLAALPREQFSLDRPKELARVRAAQADQR